MHVPIQVSLQVHLLFTHTHTYSLSLSLSISLSAFIFGATPPPLEEDIVFQQPCLSSCTLVRSAQSSSEAQNTSRDSLLAERQAVPSKSVEYEVERRLQMWRDATLGGGQGGAGGERGFVETQAQAGADDAAAAPSILLSDAPCLVVSPTASTPTAGACRGLVNDISP
jgi:hypothetical protein